MATVAVGVMAHRPMFDSRSRAAYLIVAFELVCAVPLYWWTGFRIEQPLTFLPPMWMLIPCGWLARRIGQRPLGDACETVGLIYSQGLGAMVVLFPLTALGGPLADGLLSSADRWAGFDWMAFAATFSDQSALVLRSIYNLFDFQPLVLVALAFSGKSQRAWQMVTAATIALLIALMIYPFVPALGAFHYYRVDQFQELHQPRAYGPIIEAIRNGERIAQRSMLVGFISFPSYHAVGALLYAWAAWPFKFVRWPFLIINAAMCVAALIVGGHYLIDILGGLAVGAVSLLVATILLQPSESVEQS